MGAKNCSIAGCPLVPAAQAAIAAASWTQLKPGMRSDWQLLAYSNSSTLSVHCLFLGTYSGQPHHLSLQEPLLLRIPFPGVAGHGAVRAHSPIPMGTLTYAVKANVLEVNLTVPAIYTVFTIDLSDSSQKKSGISKLFV